MSVEKAIKRLDEIEAHDHTYGFTRIIREVLESMRDLDGPFRKINPEMKPVSEVDGEKKDEQYPCDKCGVMRTRAEGGAIFTLCEKCWDDHFKPPIPSGYWFITSYWNPTYCGISSQNSKDEYFKRKSVGNCFSTEAEAREKLNRLKGE